jgi:phosphatidylethanolamine-binding protein (PEBP) family uncharacterized protein
MRMQLQSSAFDDGDRLPKRYSCDGEDLSPPLAWSGAPEDTRSFAIFCDDPRAERHVPSLGHVRHPEDDAGTA